MTTSKIKSALDDISQTIRTERQAATNAKNRLLSAYSTLGSLSTVFSDEIAAINAFTPTGEFEALAKDELSKLTSEFQSLRTVLNSANTSLSSISEF